MIPLSLFCFFYSSTLKFKPWPEEKNCRVAFGSFWRANCSGLCCNRPSGFVLFFFSVPGKGFIFSQTSANPWRAAHICPAIIRSKRRFTWRDTIITNSLAPSVSGKHADRFDTETPAQFTYSACLSFLLTSCVSAAWRLLQYTSPPPGLLWLTGSLTEGFKVRNVEQLRFCLQSVCVCVFVNAKCVCKISLTPGLVFVTL